jgi:methylated-DNA-protein-cysteine methyltransferase-like protein
MSARFSSPPEPAIFQEKVWAFVKQIPPGKVLTYGRIAALLSPPPGVEIRSYQAFGARWVAGAMATCPRGVPWQRVINAQGKISLRKGHGYEEQRELLEAEGVIFDEKDRIDLNIFGWKVNSE